MVTEKTTLRMKCVVVFFLISSCGICLITATDPRDSKDRDAKPNVYENLDNSGTRYPNAYPNRRQDGDRDRERYPDRDRDGYDRDLGGYSDTDEVTLYREAGYYDGYPDNYGYYNGYSDNYQDTYLDSYSGSYGGRYPYRYPSRFPNNNDYRSRCWPYGSRFSGDDCWGYSSRRNYRRPYSQRRRVCRDTAYGRPRNPWIC